MTAGIRQATHADIPQLVEFFLAFKRRSPYATITHDLDRARATMRRCISSPGGYLALAMPEGKIVAALMGETFEHWWSSRHYATDHILVSYQSGAGEALVRDFCRWAWSRPNVVEVLLGQSSGRHVDGAQMFYEGLGFERCGGLYRLSRYEAMEVAI